VVELDLQEPGFTGRGAIMEHQVGAGGMEAAANRCPDALAAAGDQDHLALHEAFALAID
jgi:hypothetical protein